MRKNWRKWLAALAMPFAVLVIAGCSPGSGDDGSSDGTATPSPSPTASTTTFANPDGIAAFGASGFIPTTPGFRNYSGTDAMTGDFTQEPFIGLALIENQQTICVLAVEHTNGTTPTALTPWSNGTGTPATVVDEGQGSGGATSNVIGVAAGDAAYDVNFTTATVTDVQGACAAALDPALWTTDVTTALANVTYGWAIHDMDPAAVASPGAEATMLAQLDEYLTGGMNPAMSQATFDAEWSTHLYGGAVNLGGLGTSGFVWMARAHIPDTSGAGTVNFHITPATDPQAQGQAYTRTAYDAGLAGTPLDAIFVLTSPFYTTFINAPNPPTPTQRLAEALVGTPITQTDGGDLPRPNLQPINPDLRADLEYWKKLAKPEIYGN